MTNETVKELLSLALQNSDKYEEKIKKVPFEIGKKYFIRTASYNTVGLVDKIVGNFIVFEKDTMSWIADSGRFTQAINDGELDEVEPIKVVGGLNIESIIDFFEWEHDLPQKQK